MSKQYELEYIEWMDHCSYDKSEWHSLADLKKLEPMKMVSVGWVISENKKKIVMASHMDEDGRTFLGEMCIAKKTIVERYAC